MRDSGHYVTSNFVVYVSHLVLLPPSSAEVKEWVELYLHSPICLHGVVLS